MGKVLIGWAEESIMPDNKKVSLAGQFYERISDHVESDITVTAMAVEADGDCMIMASVDVVGMSHDALEWAREKFHAICPDVDPNKLFTNVTHTHTSLRIAAVKKPDTTVGFNTPRQILAEFMPEGKEYKALVTRDDSVLSDEEGTDFVTTQIALAAKKAWESRKESLYTNEFGRAAVGMCRRVCYDDGSAQMWGDVNTANFTALEGGNDSGIELMFFYDENDKLTGVVANIACPSQVVEHRSFISSDYWGKVRILLREKYGEDLKVLGLCSPAGDQCPRDLIRWVNPETPVDDPHIERPDYIERIADPSMFDIKGTWKIGKRIVREIEDAIEEVEKTYDEALLKHNTYTIDMPVRRVTPSEYEQAVEAMEKYAAKVVDHVNFADNAKMYVHAGTILRYENQHTMNIAPIEVHVARLGDMALATSPFELFLDYGNQIRARSRAKQTILVQLACGASGYLPTKKAEKAGHYSAYVSSGITGHEGGDLLVRKTLEEINKMF